MNTVRINLSTIAPLKIKLAARLFTITIFLLSLPAVWAQTDKLVDTGGAVKTAGYALTSSESQFLARLTNVNTLITSANQLLTSYTLGPPVPQSPGAPLDQHSLDFYLKANAALDAVAPFKPEPLPANGTDLLNAILEQANHTFDVIAGAVSRGRLSAYYDEIESQARHTVDVVTALLAP